MKFGDQRLPRLLAPLRGYGSLGLLLAALLGAGLFVGLNPRGLSGSALFGGVWQRGLARRVIADTPWHRNASAALEHWRSGLLASMFQLYTAVEATAYKDNPGGAARLEPAGFDRYRLFEAIVRCPDGAPPQRVGASGDGGKWLCAVGLPQPAPGAAPGQLAAPKQQADCVVYSVGSNQQYDFEEAMLQKGCTVHTFDCHSPGKTLIEGRHFFHPACIGRADAVREGKQFLSLDSALRQNGHTRVDLLKMDIEGFEYEVLSGFSFADSCGFPAQLSMEFHWNNLYGMTPFHGARNSWDHMLWPLHRLSLAELAVVFGHLADLGYAVAFKELNPESVEFCCSEFTFVRVEQPAHCPL